MSGAEALRRVPLFAGLPDAELARVGACLRQRRYARGEVIFLAGDPGTGLALIESGRVKIALVGDDGREIVLNVYGPGEFFGEFALLDGEPRSADAVAHEACRLFWLERDHFLRYLEAQPRAAASLLAVLSRRLRHTTRLVEDAAFRDVPARLARAILDLAAARGRPAADGVVIDAHLTQAELASMVGATRETVNRSLRAYQRRGLLRLDRGRITVLRAEGLRECARPG